MINTKKCRADFLALLNNLVNESSCKEIGAQIFSLKKYLKEEYYYGKDLPEISFELVDNISEDLDYIANLYNRFILSKEFGLEDDIRKDRYNLINTASGFVKKYRLNSLLVDINYHLTDLLSVLNAYINYFGETDVIKALKCGLDIFFKERKDILEVPKINIDGKIDDDFINLISDIGTKYSADVIEKYLIKGLMSNLVFETKDAKDIDTRNLLTIIMQIRDENVRRIYG